MAVICKSCGGKTVGEASNCWDTLELKLAGQVTKCYAKWVNGQWVSGCEKEIPTSKKNFVDCLINDQDLRNYKD